MTQLHERVIAERTKLLERVRKLLAMANDNAAGGEHERAVALERAQKLMIQHHIDMGQIYAEFTREGDSITVQSDPWLRRVAHAAGMLFMTYMCYSKIAGTQKYKVTFVGQRANVETTIEMCNYLIKSIRREGAKFRRENGDVARLETNFLNAAANALIHRVFEMIETSGADLEIKSLYDRENANNKNRATEIVGEIVDGALKTDLKLDTLAQISAAHLGAHFGKTVSLSKQLG